MRDTRPDLHGLTEEEHGRLAHAVMRRQAALSIRVMIVFVILLFGLPLVNHYWPDLANTPILGFTATWLFLGVLFFPITWLLSSYFIKRSNQIEEECADWRAILGKEAGEPPTPTGVGDVQPAFIEDDVSGASPEIQNPKSKIQNEERGQ